MHSQDHLRVFALELSRPEMPSCEVTASHMANDLIFAGPPRFQFDDESSIAQDADPVRQLEDFIQPVRNVEDRPAVRSKSTNEIEQADGLAIGEGGGRLIEDEQLGSRAVARAIWTSC